MEAHIILSEHSHLYFPLLTDNWFLCTFLDFLGNICKFSYQNKQLFTLQPDPYLFYCTSYTVHLFSYLSVNIEARIINKDISLSVLPILLQNVLTFYFRWSKHFVSCFFTHALTTVLIWYFLLLSVAVFSDLLMKFCEDSLLHQI